MQTGLAKHYLDNAASCSDLSLSYLFHISLSLRHGDIFSHLAYVLDTIFFSYYTTYWAEFRQILSQFHGMQRWLLVAIATALKKVDFLTLNLVTVIYRK